MRSGTREAAILAPKEMAILKWTPAFISAAKQLSRNASPEEQTRVAHMIESVLSSEYKRHGYSPMLIAAGHTLTAGASLAARVCQSCGI